MQFSFKSDLYFHTLTDLKSIEQFHAFVFYIMCLNLDKYGITKNILFEFLISSSMVTVFLILHGDVHVY